jgi:hypothetical protein
MVTTLYFWERQADILKGATRRPPSKWSDELVRWKVSGQAFSRLPYVCEPRKSYSATYSDYILERVAMVNL